MRRALTLLLLLTLSIAAPASASARPRLIVGLGEQTPQLFGDPRFLGLGITHVRRAVAWDAIEVPSQRQVLDRWMRAARARSMDVLISFDHSNRPGHHRDVPSAAQYRRAFNLFRARYPWVSDYATWNEANYCGEITCRHPAAVASYYLAMRSACPRCNVLAAELLDMPGMAAWVRSFLHAVHLQPHLWGLHNYVGANRLSDASTRSVLALVRGHIWFTETGGLVARRNHSHADFPQSPAHAARVTAYILDHLAKLSARIERVYFYEWKAASKRDTWDSAFIGPDDRPRPAYGVLRSHVRALGMLPLCAAPCAHPQPSPSLVATR